MIVKNDDGVIRNVFPQKCPKCEADLTKGGGIVQYAVSGALRKVVLPNGLLKVVEVMRPSPSFTVCSCCGASIGSIICIQKGGELVPVHSSDNGLDEGKVPGDGEKSPENENSGEKSPEESDNIGQSDATESDDM